MAGKRELLARLLDSSGAASTFLSARTRMRTTWLTVLTYHRVADPQQASELDADVVDATPAQFDRQLSLLADRFRFIRTSDVIAYLSGGKLPPNPVLIAFDDGYLDCYTQALPILREHGATATFFIATEYVEKRRLFWWDFINMVLMRSERERVELDYPNRLTLELSGDRSSAIRTVLTVVKTHVGLDLDRFLQSLAERAAVAWDRDEEREIVDRNLMTWDQIRALQSAGMDVQSHTCTHRVLHTLSREQLCEELSGSRRVLEEQLGRPVRALAYPVGYPVAGVRRVREGLEQAGYRVGFTNSTGASHTLWRPDPFDISRIAMAREFSDAYFRAMMALPVLARARRTMPTY